MKRMSSWLANGKFNEKDEYYTPPILVAVKHNQDANRQ